MAAAQPPTMTKIRPNPPPQREPSSTPTKQRSGRLPFMVRVVISVLLVWHLTAVFLAPLSVISPAKLVAGVAQSPPMRWYLDALYLNHGYGFFGPDPPAGHTIRFEVVGTNGSVIERGEFPNTKEYRPRLLYHRYLMLADQAELPFPDQKQRDSWSVAYLESYAQHLLWSREEAQTARVQRMVHWPLPPELARQGRKLDDPEGTEVLKEVTQHRSHLQPAPGDQSSGWQGGRLNVANPWTGVTR